MRNQAGNYLYGVDLISRSNPTDHTMDGFTGNRPVIGLSMDSSPLIISIGISLVAAAIFLHLCGIVAVAERDRLILEAAAAKEAAELAKAKSDDDEATSQRNSSGA